ncbi:hypothetical protein [Geomicrobium sp. JCM 19039]|uniref:hypothetical protein n=1 Tax=Geomicrobium sp. JCM 19039 TaxID=1460636 RepID=UPI00045F2A8E|nr:hypothetical protein [Geomicrobium sp. JCM 19039]GAK10484.1 hypothetical protein JCM19039_101 [Geomicrobium sp. JCM 19039]
MESMNRKVAIVTGASRASGISTAVCLSLAKAGVDVFFTHWTAFDRIEEMGKSVISRTNYVTRLKVLA